ncbi:inositol monophosphatase family protein [Streptosporangium sp. G12]
MPEAQLPSIAEDLTTLVSTLISEIRPQLIGAALSGKHADRTNARHTGNFLSDYDLLLHDRYRELLSEIFPSFVYASEEADPQVIGDDPDPDLCVLVDPLDTSEMAVRSLYGYTHVMVYSRSLARPIAAVVGDIFHHLQIYTAARDEAGQDHAFLREQNGVTHPLRPRQAVPVQEALITNFLMKPDRFQALAQQNRLIEKLNQPAGNGNSRGRIGVDFGSVSLCHVAAGFTDATIEFSKGFAIWDLAPGHYILSAAGGTVIDLQGKPISLNYQLDTLGDIAEAMDRRQMFIAATNPALADEIAHVLTEQ